MNTLEYWDKTITLWINSFHSAATDRVWLFFSDKEVWIPLYLLIIVLLIVKLGVKKGLVAIFCIILTVAACDQLANLVKDAAARLRPNKDQWMIDRGLHILEKGGKFGFFSAHAANSYALALASTRFLQHCVLGKDVCSKVKRVLCSDAFLKYYRAFIFFWAFLVSLSRIFVAKHFLGDIFVGSLVGLTMAWIFSGLGYLVLKRATSPSEHLS